MLSFLFFLGLLLPQDLQALVSFESRLTSGYYRDSIKKNHLTLNYNWRFNYTHQSGVETFIDFGVNNNFVQDEWGLYPYQAYVSIPLAEAFEKTPFHIPRVQVGRQLLTDGFEFALIDGAVMPYYFSPRLYAKLFAGSLHIPEDTPENSFNDQLYGGSLSYRLSGAILKGGGIFKQNQSAERYLSYFTIYKNFEALPLTPGILIKEQFDVKEKSHDQSLIELRAHLAKISGTLFHSSRRVDPLLSQKKRLIYQLFAVDKQKSFGTTGTWDIHEMLQIEGRFERVEYHSRVRKEIGDQGTGSLIIGNNNYSISPFLTRLSSYGGYFWDYGLSSKIRLKRELSLELESNTIKYKKINGMSGFAYHALAGISLVFPPNWQAKALIELERNHLYKLDSRALFHVSHFYF